MTTYKPVAAQASPLTPGTPHSARWLPARATPHSLAFTLVEMIVVTGIIAVLAALIFPVTAAVKKSRDLSRARAELMLVAHAIDGYKDKLGHFPPDNTTADLQRCLHSQLFYELCGTFQTNNGNSFCSLDKSVTIPSAQVLTAFGTAGFINCTRGGGDEAQPAQKFLPELRAGQYLDTTVNGVNCRVLGCSLDGPNATVDPVTSRKFNPWCYNYSNPTNGAAPYDLCVDIKVGNRVYRVSNWSTTPQVVP